MSGFFVRLKKGFKRRVKTGGIALIRNCISGQEEDRTPLAIEQNLKAYRGKCQKLTVHTDRRSKKGNAFERPWPFRIFKALLLT
jgi:hypothetical protein